MNDTNNLDQAKDPDVRASLGALRRAALSARTTAIQTGTHLVIAKDGRVQRIAAHELALKAATTTHPT